MDQPKTYWIGIDGRLGLLVMLGEGLEPSVEWHEWEIPVLPKEELDLVDIVRWALANGYLAQSV